MLEMKLPMRTAEEGGGDTAEDEQEQTDCNVHIRGSVSQTASNRPDDSARGLRFPHHLDKETVFEWFGLHLNPAKRIEFMCGLLHMCQPLELRFLGACLEDLARKDFHVLRDFEIRANSPNELGLLTDVADPVVRSKLLVCLSLLGSENRECAGLLFRILSHVDPALYFKNYGFPISSYRDPQHLQFHPPCEDGDEYGKSDQSCGPPAEAGVGPLEQLALLFTMASLHPAFPFHQRENFRIQLNKVDVAIEEERQNYQDNSNALGSGGCTCGCTSLPLHTSGTVHADKLQQNKVPKTDYLSPNTETSLSDRAQSLHTNQSPSRKPQREAVHIERIVLQGISRSREYSFVVKWSDASSSHVTKTHHDLENFLLKLPKELSTESFEKGILSLLRQGDKCESRELERTLKEKFLSAPQSFRQTGKVCGFFLSESSGLSYSRCNPVPVGKPFKEDCSEASSQEEDLEPYPQGHRKKPGSKSPSLGTPSAKGSQAESRRTPHSEHNGVPDWRRKGCPLKPANEACSLCPEQLFRDEEKWSSLPGNKTKVRTPVTDREKGKKMEGSLGYIPNGIMRTAPVQPLPQPSGKDVRLDAGSGQDTYGETSSESYSSPSSPQHDGRESLESEDEKDKDTDSHSDDSSRGKTEHLLPCKGMGGAAFSTVLPLVPVPLKEVRSGLESSLGAPRFPQLSFMHPVPYLVQNGAVGPEGAADSKATGGLMVTVPAAGGEAEKQAPVPAFGPQTLALQQPLVQRFKTAAPGVSSEGCVPPTHQPPVGAISVLPPGPAYVSPLQPAYPPIEPVMSSGLPPSLPLPETHPKAPGLPLPSGLPPSYSLPAPSTTIPSVGALGGPVASQVQAMVPPVVPTHTPGPAPSPSPALTHSTAQSDSTSYINSTSCGNSQQQQQQQQQQPQQQPTPSQQPGCGTCGCRGSCGSGHAPNYYFPHQLPRQVFSVPPIFHLTSLCSSSYLSQAHQSNGAGQLPFFPHGPSAYASAPPPLLHSHSDHVLGSQAGYGLQQMAAFNRFFPPVYPSVSMMPGGGGMAVGMKKNGNISCYNCGVSGHFAQDCKQPSIDAAQKGGFRLKYVTPHSSEALDNAD